MTAPTLPQHERIAARQRAILLKLAEDAQAALARGEPLDVWSNQVFRSNPSFGSRDRRFYGDALFALFRWQGALDHAHLSDPLARLQVAWCLDGRTEPSPLSADASLDEAIARARTAPPRSWVPDWLPGCYFDPAHLDNFVRSIQQRPPTWLRCARGQRAIVAAACERRGAHTTEHPRLPDALAIDRPLPLSELLRETNGAFAVQDLASQAVGAVCNPAPGSTWWDVCAGAGGKTLDLAERMENRGILCASDARETALAELMRRARAAGVTILRDGEGIASFDGVLVDAPCSGIGTWSRNPDMRWRTTADVIPQKAREQADLLDEVASKVAAGGHLIYAVCTVTRDETDAVIDGFLARHPDFRPAAFAHPLTGTPVAGSIQLLPEDGPCGGMYIARLQRSGAQS